MGGGGKGPAKSRTGSAAPGAPGAANHPPKQQGRTEHPGQPASSPPQPQAARPATKLNLQQPARNATTRSTPLLPPLPEAAHLQLARPATPATRQQKASNVRRESHPFSVPRPAHFSPSENSTQPQTLRTRTASAADRRASGWARSRPQRPPGRDRRSRSGPNSPLADSGASKSANHAQIRSAENAFSTGQPSPFAREPSWRRLLQPNLRTWRRCTDPADRGRRSVTEITPAVLEQVEV